VANRFTASGHGELRMSNGSTDVFFDMLTLAGSGLATTAWEQNLVLYFRPGGLGSATRRRPPGALPGPRPVPGRTRLPPVLLNAVLKIYR
jgi:hypothetical protein